MQPRTAGPWLAARRLLFAMDGTCVQRVDAELADAINDPMQALQREPLRCML